MQFHGNPIPSDEDPMYLWRIKSQGNEEARQQFLDGYVPQIWELGLDGSGPEAAQARRRRVGVHRARLGRAQARRHRPRPEDRGAARVPPPLPRAGAVGAGRSGCMSEPIWEVFRKEKRGAAVRARRLGRRSRRGLRGGVGARAVRPARRVGRALARPARRDPRRRGLGRRVRPQVPPRRRLLDQGPPEGGA